MISENDQSIPVQNAAELPTMKDFDWIEVFNHGGFITDQSWKLLQWNRNFRQYLDKETDSNLQNKDVFHLLGLYDYRPEINIDEIRTITFTLPGTELSFTLRIKAVLRDGEIIGLGMISRNELDATDEEWCNHFQYQLIKNQQIHILEKRLEGLIHNVNTPLNTIIGYVQILLRESPESKALQKIMESGFQIDSSLKSIQEKIEMSRSRFKQFIEVNQVILNELELSRNDLFFKHNVHVELSLAEELPKIDMIYGDLSYGLDAILWNAIESLMERENKNIYIETKVENNWLEIVIKDTGCGILSKDMPFIYEYGFSTKNATNSEHLGLGLSFTRRVIHDYKGKIAINSEPQVGTTVTIDLPLEDLS